MARFIALITDFGPQGPYVGQLQAVLASEVPDIPVVDLLSNAPVVRPKASAYLVAALAEQMPVETLFLTVIDPGVGGERKGLIVKTDRFWFVGPDNGLLAVVARRSKDCRVWSINWQPPKLSSSFHGRDLFAPVAACIARGDSVPGVRIKPEDMIGWDWPNDLSECIYIDHYGNVYTGLRAREIDSKALLDVAGHRLSYARTFDDVPPGSPFWYENSCGLVEIAVNQGRADQLLGLTIEDPVNMELPAG